MPRAFISVAIASAWRGFAPVSRAAPQHARPLPAHAVSEHDRRHRPERRRVKQQQARVEPGVDEEQRHQQRHRQRLDRPAQFTREDAARHAHAQHEGAEHGVDADKVGEPRAACQQAQDGHQSRELSVSSRSALRGEPFKQPAADAEPDHRDGNAAPPAATKASVALTGEAAQHDREHHPCRGVVHRAGGKRRASRPSFPAMPRSEMMRASTGKAVIDIAAPTNSTACTGRTWAVKKPPLLTSGARARPPSTNGNAMPAADNAERAPPELRHEIETELEADREHVEHEPDLAQHVQRMQRNGGEDPRPEAPAAARRKTTGRAGNRPPSRRRRAAGAYARKPSRARGTRPG